jgi:hypothetical protein
MEADNTFWHVEWFHCWIFNSLGTLVVDEVVHSCWILCHVIGWMVPNIMGTVWCSYLCGSNDVSLDIWYKEKGYQYISIWHVALKWNSVWQRISTHGLPWALFWYITFYIKIFLIKNQNSVLGPIFWLLGLWKANHSAAFFINVDVICTLSIVLCPKNPEILIFYKTMN